MSSTQRKSRTGRRVGLRSRTPRSRRSGTRLARCSGARVMGRPIDDPQCHGGGARGLRFRLSEARCDAPPDVGDRSRTEPFRGRSAHPKHRRDVTSRAPTRDSRAGSRNESRCPSPDRRNRRRPKQTEPDRPPGTLRGRGRSLRNPSRGPTIPAFWDSPCGPRLSARWEAADQ